MSDVGPMEQWIPTTNRTTGKSAPGFYVTELATIFEFARHQDAKMAKLVAALEGWDQVREHKLCHCNACAALRAALKEAAVTA